MIWHIFIVSSAWRWLSGVTPAQQLASTVIRRDAGTAARVHGDGRFGHRRLEQQRVGHYADVGAEADQLDFQRLLRALGHQNTGEPVGAEGGLVDNGRLLRGLGDRIVELPAVGALDAVLDGQSFCISMTTRILRMAMPSCFFQMRFHFAPFGTSVTSMPRAFSSSRMRSASAKFFAFLASAR